MIKVLAAGAAAAAAVSLSATTALATTASPAAAKASPAAAKTFRVSPGGKYTSKAGKTVLKDNRSGAKLTCSSASASGRLKRGRHLSGKSIGVISSSKFNKCSGPLGLKFKVRQSGKWTLNITKYSSKKGGVATGYIGKVHATLSGTGCAATVTGSTDVTYSNRTHKLTVKPVRKSGHVLKISKVTGCFTLIKNGDTSGFTGSYKISPKQKIT